VQHVTFSPGQLSEELRVGRSPDLSRRRWAIGLSFASAGIGMVVGAYQTGMLRRLPDVLRGKLWDAQKVDGSDYAYKRLQTPDGLLMTLSYAATACLIGAGGQDRRERQPWLAVAAAVKAWGDLLFAMKLTREEYRDNRALCSWCQMATLLTAGTAVLTAPEAYAAGRTLAGQAR
jgi:hypothetical protein